jgi:hypothetical protein
MAIIAFLCENKSSVTENKNVGEIHAAEIKYFKVLSKNNNR